MAHVVMRFHHRDRLYGVSRLSCVGDTIEAVRGLGDACNAPALRCKQLEVTAA